jgi:hypothetical protein
MSMGNIYVDKELHDIIKRVLADERIFSPPYDAKNRRCLPKIIDNCIWEELNKDFCQGRNNGINIINESWERIKTRINKLHYKSYCSYYNALKNAYNDNSKEQLLRIMFYMLPWYGVVNCNLPSMDDFGIVIERHDYNIVKQFFLDKEKRAGKSYIKNALIAVLSYTEELYDKGYSNVLIAYFIRKIDSLQEYWGLLLDERRDYARR